MGASIAVGGFLEQRLVKLLAHLRWSYRILEWNDNHTIEKRLFLCYVGNTNGVVTGKEKQRLLIYGAAVLVLLLHFNRIITDKLL